MSRTAKVLVCLVARASWELEGTAPGQGAFLGVRRCARTRWFVGVELRGESTISTEHGRNSRMDGADPMLGASLGVRRFACTGVRRFACTGNLAGDPRVC